MSTTHLCRLVLGFALVLSSTVGCNGEPQALPSKPAPALPKAAEVKRIPAGQNVTLEILPDDKRRVLVNATVCLREGQLEMFLCRKQTKEHEAILTADVDARRIHMALEAAGAKAGTPVKYDPKYEPATGARIKVSVQYEDKGKQVTVPAQRWIKNAKTNKDLAHDWVFGGSRLLHDPTEKDKPPFYEANGGDIICVSNFSSAMLDLPISSPKDDADLVFVAATERIPPLDTKVVVILELIPEGPKK